MLSPWQDPSVIRIEEDLIDNDSDGASGAVTGVSFTPIPGVSNGVGYWADKNAICVVTMGGKPPEGATIHIIPEGSFPRTDLPAPWRGAVGTADGIAFTSNGTIVTARFSGDLLAVPSTGEPFPLRVARFAAPGRSSAYRVGRRNLDPGSRRSGPEGSDPLEPGRSLLQADAGF